MPDSEYARSEYEEDSEFVMTDEEDDHRSEPALELLDPHPPPPPPRLSPPNEKQRLEILDHNLCNPTLNNSPDNPHQIPPIQSSSSSIRSHHSSNFIQHVDLVMNKVKTLESDTRWNRVLKHRTGLQVFAQKHTKAIGKSKIIPVFKGVGLIKGYSPASVFAVIGSSKLWDEWYEDGNLVENLSDQVSLTYMCMKAGIGTRTRDLSLVEKVEATTDGSIYFCASSVDTPRVPTVPSRIRAHIELNGWVLQPIILPESTPGVSTTATKVTYYLQVDVKTFVAEAISQRYLARRPLCITKIDSYLQKYGSPIQLEGISEFEAHPKQGGTRRSFSRNFMSLKQVEFPKELLHDHASSSAPNPMSTRGIRSHLTSIGSFGQKSRRNLPSSVSVPSFHLSKSPTRKPLQSGLPERTLTPNSPSGSSRSPLLINHVKPNQARLSWNSLIKALELFQAYLKDSNQNQKNWRMIENSTNSVQMRLNSVIVPVGQSAEEEGMYQLPIVQSQASLNTLQEERNLPVITEEQVLMTILSNLAQQTWDENFLGCSKLGNQTQRHQILLSTDNGFDQGTYLGNMRAVYPHLRDESVFCFDQLVVRSSDPQLADEIPNPSKIVVIQRSVEDEERYLKVLEHESIEQIKELSGQSILREKIDQKLLSKIQIGGWMIKVGKSAAEIEITHLSAMKLNLKNQKPVPLTSTNHSNWIPNFLPNLIASNVGNRPQQVCQFIKEFGFSPGFIRWMDGPIQYYGDHEVQGDDNLPNSSSLGRGIKHGVVEWWFAVKSQPSHPPNHALQPAKPTSFNQTCWFQWSDQMYPHGIELNLEPPDLAEVKLVSDMHNTLQFHWKTSLASLNQSSSTNKILIKLRARRIQSSDTEGESATNQRVSFNGNRSIAVVRVNSLQRKSSSDTKVPTIIKTETDEIVGHKDSSKDQALSNGIVPKDDPHKHNVGDSNGKPTEKTSRSLSSNSSKPIQKNLKPPDAGSRHQQILVEPNVAIIINRNIYFTRSQVLFFLVCVVVAYVYGKLG